MGCVVSFAKKVWNGIKYLTNKVWNGIKYVAKKVSNFVKTTIGKVVVMVAVATSLVAGSIIANVLASFPLGLLSGGALFLSILITSVMIFGRDSKTKRKDEDKDKDKNNDNTLNNVSKNNVDDKPNHDEPTKEKPFDHLDEFIEDFSSFFNFFNKKGKDIAKKKGKRYTFDKNGKSEKIENNNDNPDDDNDDKPFNNDKYVNSNVITCDVNMDYK